MGSRGGFKHGSLSSNSFPLSRWHSGAEGQAFPILISIIGFADVNYKLTFGGPLASCLSLMSYSLLASGQSLSSVCAFIPRHVFIYLFILLWNSKIIFIHQFTESVIMTTSMNQFVGIYKPRLKINICLCWIAFNKLLGNSKNLNC